MSMYNTSVPVLYEQLVAGGVQEVCGVVEVETHTSCRCGCEEVECTSLQMYDKRMCQCRCRDQGAMGQCLVQYNKVSMYMVVVVGGAVYGCGKMCGSSVHIRFLTISEH